MTESMPSPTKIEAYLNFVADPLDLRRSISFGTEVLGMTFDADAAQWRFETSDGDTYAAQFVVAASGVLSGPAGARHFPVWPPWSESRLRVSCWPDASVWT